MRLRLARPSRGALIEAAPFVVVLAAAVYVYTRFHSSLQLTRDEGIYVYSAVRLTHGVPPYQSIWDPKTPGTSMLGALSIKFGHVVGLHALDAIRFVFFGTAVLTALSVYLLGRVLWHSIPAALVGAGVFLCFESFAFEAPSGPDAKMPGVFLAVLTMALVVRRRWILAGFASGIAFLFWQPLLIYVATAAVAAVLVPGRARWRAVGSVVLAAAVPIGATCIYFAAEGAFRVFIDAAFVQPATGAQPYTGFVASIEHIQMIITQFEMFNMWTFWIGVGAVFVLTIVRLIGSRRGLLDFVRDPLVCVVLLSLLAVLAFSVRAFLNYPWMDPLLPYAGIGFGGVFVLVRDLVARVSEGAVTRIGVPVVCCVATLALLGASVSDFSNAAQTKYPSLALQRQQACALDRVAGPGTLYSFGDTASLVLAHRTNPDNFIYFGGGVLVWKLAHLHGRVEGWERQIRAAHASVLVFNMWDGPLRQVIGTWLKKYYHATYIGSLRVFLSRAARARARRDGVIVSPTRIKLDEHDRAGLVKSVSAQCV